MAPAQALATLESERSPGSLTQKENRDICEVNLRCTNNRQDDTFGMEALLNQHQVEEADDMEVGITDCTKTSVRLLDEEDPDATEYSSSFGGTLSGSENGFKLNSSDGEVESQFRTENEPSVVFDGVNGLFSTRKKRLTAHWRRYICPLMWRCKWIELRVKELHSQASKYDKELLAYSNEKQLWTREPSLDGPVARSMPLSSETQKNRAMKRRKRRRMEDTVDIPSYMSRHSLFSYYENKNMVPDGLSFDCDSAVTQAEPNHHVTDECGVSWEWLPLQSKDGDSSLEQILWNIEVLQSRVERLQTKLDKVVSRNGGKQFLTEILSNFVPSDVLNSSAQSPNIFPANGDETLVRGLYTPPGHISDYEIEDLVGPESAVSSFGDANLPDIIESTRGLLSAVDRSLIQPQMGDFCKETADDILIHNQSAKEGLHDFEKVTKLIEKSEEAAQEHSEEKHTPKALAPETDQVEEPVPPSTERETGLAHGLEPEKLGLGSCLAPQFQRVPKNKRKRRHHKATSGRWNAGKVYRRRSSGLNQRK